MENELHAKIDELLRLTKEMHSLALAEQWDDVEACEQQRIDIIAALTPLEHEADQSVVVRVRQIIERNTEIVALANAEKDKISDELKLFKKLGQAEKAYRIIDAG